MTYLLDVNVLIALVDPAHVSHDAAHRWFLTTGAASWASCPITENGLIRIVGHPRYPGGPGSPAAVMPVLRSLRDHPGHQFWPDDVSLVDAQVDPTRLLSPGQVTDSYLLLLARRRKARLASFDRRLVTLAVDGGDAVLHLIG